MKPATRSFYEDAVRQAVAQIAANLDGALDLTELARAAALSPLHFHHVFRGMLGETPLELHRRLRLERAAIQLSDTDAAVTTIAFDAGYETHESFTRAFRKVFAEAPSEFRTRAAAARTACERPPATWLAARSGIHLHQPEPMFHGDNDMTATIETMPEMLLASVHHIGPYNQISKAFAKLGPLAGRAGLFALPGVMMVGIYYDDPETTPAAELQSDAGLVIPAGTPIPDGLASTTIPAGRYAMTTHRGPYDRLGDTWGQLFAWIAQQNHRVAHNKSFEIYRNDPTNTAPADLVTDLYAPIR